MDFLMQYLFLGLTVFAAVISALQINNLIITLIEKKLRMKAHLCEICGINDQEVTLISKGPDGLPCATSMCRPCARESQEFHEAQSRRESDGLEGTEQ